MVVLLVEKVHGGLRGELSRWMVELRSGVFVGNLSAMVRDKLWEETCRKLRSGAAILVYTTNNEQGFALRLSGDLRREVADFDGLLLVRERP